MRRLPFAGSHLHRAEHREATGGWTVTDHLLATVADRLDLVHRDLHGLGGSKRPPKPNPIRRPGDPDGRISWADMARRLVNERR